MRIWRIAAGILLAGCGGAMRVDPPTASTVPATVAATDPAPAPAIATADSAPAAPTNAARPAVPQPALDAAPDSVADAAALDSLATAAPAASLPELPVATRATWDLNISDFADQPRVRYYLDYFTGPARDRFQVWLDRMARYEAYARAQFVAHKLPSDFVYLALIESGFSPDAVSRTAAVGIWQFMPGTGRTYGLRIDSWVDERRDPIKATDAAAQLLDDLTQRFGSHYLAAAAYNAGAGRVERGLDHINSPNSTDDDSVDIASDDAFFSLADTRLIRDETKNYVPQLIAAAMVAKEPFKYGFDPRPSPPPFPRDSVLVEGGTGLDLMARLADTTLDAMRQLNPQLLRLITPPDQRYPVRVPAGSATRIADAYAAIPDDQRSAIAEHRVRAGESVATLSRKYHVSAALIRSANRDARGRALVMGSMVYLPVNTTIPAALLREPDPPRRTRTIIRSYVVRRGESLAGFSRRVGAPVNQLRRDNHLTATGQLRAGQKLLVRRTVVTSPRRAATTRHPPAARKAAARSSPSVGVLGKAR